MSKVLRGGWAGVNFYQPGGETPVLVIPKNHLLQNDTGFDYNEDFEALAGGGRALAGIAAEVMVVTMNIDDADLAPIFTASDEVALMDIEFVSLKAGASVRFSDVNPSVSGGGGTAGTFLHTRISGMGYAHDITALRNIVTPAS